MNEQARPAVSLVMPVFNAARTISLTLRSIQRQTHAEWELVLIDDGSSDETVRVAREIDDSRIKITTGRRNLGLPARLNQGLEMAVGNYIARIDADDVAYPERLEQQLRFLEAQPEVSLLGTRALVFGDDGAVRGMLPFRATHEEITSSPRSGFYLAHPTWMGRADWFRRYRYDVSYRKAQDQELLLRAFHGGGRFACLPEVLVGYRQEALSLEKILAGRYAFCRALLAGARRDGRWLRGTGAVMEQALKAMVDVLSIRSGTASRVLRHRALPASTAHVDRWNRLWKELHAAG